MYEVRSSFQIDPVLTQGIRAPAQVCPCVIHKLSGLEASRIAMPNDTVFVSSPMTK